MNRFSASLTAAAAIAALAACATARAGPPDDDTCNASEVRPWIGKRATPSVRADIARATEAKTIRWLYPKTMVTADHDPSRLNIKVTKASDMIRSARCG